MDRPRDPAQWNISKIMTAWCQITCTIPWLPRKQLPYLPEHPRILRMRQRDKSNLPLPVLSYKYFLLGYSFSILSFYSPKSTFAVAASPEDSKNFNEGLLHQSLKSSIFLSQENGHQLHRAWGQFTTLLVYTFTVLLFIRDSFYWILLFPFLFILLSPQTFRIWPIRSLFLPINLTSNVLAR